MRRSTSTRDVPARLSSRSAGSTEQNAREEGKPEGPARRSRGSQSTTYSRTSMSRARRPCRTEEDGRAGHQGGRVAVTSSSVRGRPGLVRPRSRRSHRPGQMSRKVSPVAPTTRVATGMPRCGCGHRHVTRPGSCRRWGSCGSEVSPRVGLGRMPYGPISAADVEASATPRPQAGG